MRELLFRIRWRFKNRKWKECRAKTRQFERDLYDYHKNYYKSKGL